MLKKIINYKADYMDVLLAETGAMAFALLFAKFWSPLLSLNWYWYLIIGIVAAYKPVNNCLKS
tara:strand:+ start:192 stop:380 length:189 start_codon:yes stop_codon:yes gene_type:complete